MFADHFSPLTSELCGHRVFAGDIPRFGCGSAALVKYVVPIENEKT
jgi:hypothetical protein